MRFNQNHERNELARLVNLGSIDTRGQLRVVRKNLRYGSGLPRAACELWPANAETPLRQHAGDHRLRDYGAAFSAAADAELATVV